LALKATTQKGHSSDLGMRIIKVINSLFNFIPSWGHFFTPKINTRTCLIALILSPSQLVRFQAMRQQLGEQIRRLRGGRDGGRPGW